MPAVMRHFAINADDVARARAFYESVFGWVFRPWGPPEFYQIDLPGLWGALQQRHELVPGQRSNTFRLTFGVPDAHATLAAATSAGGRVRMQPYQIEGGPEVGYIEDTEGNIVGVARYGTEPPPGAPPLLHFAVNADDVARAKGFYERVFGWSFDPWGPPNYYHTRDAGQECIGALQERRELRAGTRITSLDTTFAVPDIRATLAQARAKGGHVLMQPYLIEGVGEIGYFEDTEGNACGVAQYVHAFR